MADTSPKPRNVYIDDELWAWVKQQAAAPNPPVTISQALRECIALARDVVNEIGGPGTLVGRGESK